LLRETVFETECAAGIRLKQEGLKQQALKREGLEPEGPKKARYRAGRARNDEENM
jgi:hypothetical protein